MNAIIERFESVWTALVAEEHVLAAKLRKAIDELRGHADAQAAAPATSSGTASGSATSEAAPAATSAPVATAPATTAPVVTFDYAKWDTVEQLAIFGLQRAPTDAELDAWYAVHPNVTRPAASTSSQPPVDETQLQLGNDVRAGTHPLVVLNAKGDYKDLPFGPFAGGTKVKVGTVEVSGGSAIELDILSADGTVLDKEVGLFKDEAYATIVADEGVTYKARIYNINDGPVGVHVQLFDGADGK